MIRLLLNFTLISALNLLILYFATDFMPKNLLAPEFKDSILSSDLYPKISSLALKSVHNFAQFQLQPVKPVKSDLKFDILAKYSLFKKENLLQILEVKSAPSSNSCWLNLYTVHGKITLKKWELRVKGKIVGVAASRDKNDLAVAYQVAKGSDIRYRIKYVPDFYSSDSFERENNSPEDAFNASLIGSSRVRDILLPGNSPVVALAVYKDILVYGRNIDSHAYHILRFPPANSFWQEPVKEVATGPELEKLRFYSLKSIRLLKTEKPATVKLLVSFIELRDQDLREQVQVHHVSLTQCKVTEKELISSSYNLEPLQKGVPLREIIERKNIFSSSIGDNFIFKYKKEEFISVQYNSERDVHHFTESSLSSSKTKVRLVAQDAEGENVLVSHENNKLSYVIRDISEDNTVTEHVRKISLQNVPVSVRESTLSAIYLEKTSKALIAYLLSSRGDIHVLDLTSPLLNFSKKHYIVKVFLTSFQEWVIFLIVGLNAAILLFCLEYKPNSMRLTEEASSIIQNIARLTRNLSYARNTGRTRRIISDFNATKDSIEPLNKRKMSY